MDQNPSLTQKVINYFNPPPELVPQEGWQSLRWLRWDLIAGTVMTPVSYVFALSISAIALMSPMTGIYAGILGCIMLWIMRGSNLGIAGPAAALAPILAGAILVLGKGDIAKGQLLVLPVIFTAGVLMLIIAWRRWARFTSMVSHAVVDGAILGYIGYSIVIRQIPNFYGVKFHDKSLWGIFWETITLQHIGEINHLVLAVGMITLGIIIVHLVMEARLLKTSSPIKSILAIFPPQLFATAVAIYFGYTLTMDAGTLIHLPDDISIDYTLGWKGTKMLWADPSLWPAFALFVFKLTMVDTIETCGTVLGIDNKDKFNRVSDPNNALRAMAIANIVGSLGGNQSHIPGGMKSGTNAVLGAKTRNACLINGILMAMGITFAATRGVINHIPLVALSAVIGYAGYRLCAPSVWKHFWHKGPECTKIGKQVITVDFIVFAGGFLISAFTGEILIGFFAAIFIEFALTYRQMHKCALSHAHSGVSASPFAIIKRIFGDPIAEVKLESGETGENGTKVVWHFTLHRSITTFNWRHLQQYLLKQPGHADDIFIDATHPEVTSISGTALERLSSVRKGLCGTDNFIIYGFHPEARHGAGLIRIPKRTGNDPTYMQRSSMKM